MHRVGRTARQGKTGLAISLVEPEDLPYMVDLHLFLGLPLRDSFHRTPNSSTPSRNIATWGWSAKYFKAIHHAAPQVRG